MSELIARGKGKRILVVAVKSMMLQFQKEIWNRFAIPLIRLDSNRIAKIRASMPSNHNPFFRYDKTIISMDTLKRDVEYRTHLENSWWDIIVIDEAQNVAERGKFLAQRARLAKLLAGRSDTLIMLSATPHDGRSESFASLMNMLDPTAIADKSKYGKEEIKGLFVRRFKKDIKEQAPDAFKERKVYEEKSPATALEEAAFDVFAKLQLEMDVKRQANRGQLFKTTLEKAMFSSPLACVESIDNRLKKLRAKGDDGLHDVRQLEEFRAALAKITPADFSRYQKLLSILQSPDYDWRQGNDDRVVIFTERIETLDFLAKQLRLDLNLSNKEVQIIKGEMSDAEQIQIVEAFGLEGSPIRLLIASDVASEGINLHYRCHRLIHFDIHWSLMVFQQRNGRIDRYGQKERPDIRYLMIESENEKIKGDARIIEILVQKEGQAYANIGDPKLLMGKSSVEEEEDFTAAAIEDGVTAEEFRARLDQLENEFNPFEALLAAASKEDASVQTTRDKTLFSDLEYLKMALPHFSGNSRNPVKDLQTVEGVEIGLSPDLRRRLAAVLPEEVMPREDFLRLSPDKRFVMSEMTRSLQNNQSDTTWPETQFLWKLHPLFVWLNEKGNQIFGRNEAPVIGLPSGLGHEEVIFVMAGTIQNRQSTPIVDEWFGLHYKNGLFTAELSMSEVLAKTNLTENKLPNRNSVPQETIDDAAALLETVVADARGVMARHFQSYNEAINPKISEEIDKLGELEKRHITYWQSFFEDEDKKNEKKRQVGKLFGEFADWVHNTLEIQDSPYIRVIAALTGASY
jgi:superfamily II DNA or RNA helicase